MHRLFALYAAELEAFDLIDGNRVIVAGDFDGDRSLTVQDIDLLSAEIRRGERDSSFDLNRDEIVNTDDFSDLGTRIGKHLT